MTRSGSKRQCRHRAGWPASKGSSAKAAWLAQRAHSVVAANDVIAEWLSEYADDIHVIPSVVDAHAFTPRVHEPREDITVVWIGSHSTAPYLRRLAAPLQAAINATRPTNVQFIAVGAPPAAVDDLPIRCIPWTVETERTILRSADIGLMPIPDTPFTRAKSAHKAILYMAVGIPVIADDVGLASNVIANAGKLVRDETDWTNALVELINDPQVRTGLGSTGAHRAREEFSVRTWAPALAAVLDDSA